MLADNNDRPGLEEQYLTATSSSNLTLNPDATCAATHLIAAGLLGNRMGAALVHLRSEWDAADKPRKATEEEAVYRAGLVLAVLGAGKKGKPDVKRARGELLIAYARALRHRAHSIPGWLPALAIMGEWAAQRGVDRDLLSPALYHHLHPTCLVCDGLGSLKMPDAPVLGKQCYACGGEGKANRSFQAQRVDDWLKSCLGKAKGDRRGLLNGWIDSDDLKDRAAARPTFPAQERTQGDDADAAYFRDSMGKPRKP